MAWNFLQRIVGSKAADGAKSAGGATPRAESPTSEEERVRRSARRRLIGAGVLVVLTVAIFPWVFERQPKPVNDDIVIEIPRKEGAKPLPLPVATGSAGAASAASAASAAASIPAPAPSYPAITRIVGDAPATPDPKPVDPGLGRSPVAAVLGAVASDQAPVVTPVIAPVTAPAASKPAAAVAVAPKASAAVSAPKPTASAPAASGRFIVQVAAFSEAIKARDTRLKLEAAGYKTYSQAIETPKGKVWRVRIGPVDNRAKADAVKAKMLLQGFNAVVIEL